METLHGPSDAHASRQAIDAANFDAKAGPAKPHVNHIRGKLVVLGMLVLLPKQWVAGSNPVSRSALQEPRLDAAWVSCCAREVLEVVRGKETVTAIAAPLPQRKTRRPSLRSPQSIMRCCLP